VSNLSVENSKSFTRLTSNAGVFSIQSGTDGSTNGPITFGGFSNERLRITADGNVGIGTTNPVAKLHLTSGQYDGSTLINLTVNQSSDATVYYRKIAFVNNNSGHVLIKGVLGGHRQSQGNATVDVKFSVRDGFTALGTCMGTLGNSNILVKDNTGLSRKDIYLVTGLYSYVNLQVYAIGGEVFGTNENQPTSTAPSGDTTHDLKLNFNTFRVDDDGNVGIGTDNPNAKLDVQGSAVITGLTYGIKSTGTLGSDKTEGWYRLLIGGFRDGTSAIRTKCKLQVGASGLHQSLTFDFNHMINLSQTSGNSFNLLGNDHYISRVGVTKLRLADAGSDQFALDMYIDHDVVPIDREWDITLYTEGGSIISEASTFLEKITATPSASIEISTDTTIFGIVGNTTSRTLVMHENGNVGIGVTGPQTTLDVNGTIKNTNPAFWAYTSGGATTTLAGIFDGGGSPARALFSSTDLNIGSCYSTSNGRFTAPVAGRYAFFGQVLLRRGSNTGHVSSELTLYKNGTNVNGRGLAYSTVSNDSGEHDNLRLFYILDLAKDQYVQIGMYSIGTGSDVYYGERLANFSGYLLG